MHFFVFEIWVGILCLHYICVEDRLTILYLSYDMLTLLKLLMQFGVTIFNKVVTNISFEDGLVKCYIFSYFWIISVFRFFFNGNLGKWLLLLL